MEISYTKDRIKMGKELNSLDKFVIDFTRVLNRMNVKYVIVSGYVSIIFGRSRSSEDIDMFIEPLSSDRFDGLWKGLRKKFECIITDNLREAYDEYLGKSTAIRFSYKGAFIPNMEIKFPKMEVDRWALENRKTVILNDNELFISPLELQIPFKLYLGSEKDIEDAKHLYQLFRDHLDLNLLSEFNRKLKVVELFNRYLK
jgi:hypothetical protein